MWLPPFLGRFRMREELKIGVLPSTERAARPLPQRWVAFGLGGSQRRPRPPPGNGRCGNTDGYFSLKGGRSRWRSFHAALQGTSCWDGRF